MGFVMAGARWLLDLVFPKYCAGCGTEGSFCCAACRLRLITRVPACPVCGRRNFTGILCDACSERLPLRRFLAPFSYRDPLVRELIHAYKYRGARELSAFFADELASFFSAYAIRPPGPALLVPIPLHRSRERERGFNQARLLANDLGKRLGLPVADALRRMRANEPQVSTDSFKKRYANVAGVFRVADQAAVAGRTAILIDDVSTSGATLGEAARVLRKADCRTVWGAVIAKG
ncbi:MAG: ComF family protein [Candidatus Sungbacteria bacterium]|uniref:ComF family protein n=1 Tax=Candidatus Sungiibacteriota bacterium TaxID=2750080 RepID=A0A933DT24_9BACT|nr:ComF family protein [Candidatus Sungbacteria bacterium]